MNAAAVKVARLKDVAAEAGLSETTVSRHLNNSISLPDATRRRIDAAVSKLHYRANPQARSLSRGRSDQIGLVIPDLTNPFFAQIAAMVERAADEAGLALLLCTTSNRRGRELDYVHRLQQNQIDGMLLITNHGDDQEMAAAINASNGIVLLDEDVAGTTVPKLFADNEYGGWLAARHLLEHGHRALAMIGGPLNLMSSREREAGFRHAVDRFGGASVTAFYPGAYTREHGRTSTVRLLRRHKHTTAVFTGNDEILVGVLEALQDQRIRVPDQISVVTFDDVEPLHLFDPPITAIRQDVPQMGRRAVQLMLDRADVSEASTGPERITVELIARRSVATRPA